MTISKFWIVEDLQTFTSSTSTSSSTCGTNDSVGVSINSIKAVHWHDQVQSSTSGSSLGNDRKRNRKAFAGEESAFDDIMGQSKSQW